MTAATAPITYARLRVTDPGRWRAAALSWRRWAALAGAVCAEFDPLVGRLRAGWRGAAADAAADRLGRLRRRLVVFRLLCWRADQALSEFAATLSRARDLLERVRVRARQQGLSIDDAGAVHGPAGAVGPVAAELAAALTVAARADEAAAARLIGLAGGAGSTPIGRFPDCAASPAEMRRWWAGLSAAQRDDLIATAPGVVAIADGLPVADRDLANRLLLEERIESAGRDRNVSAEVREGLDRLAGRLADEAGPRAYLIRFGIGGEGGAVVALGDPDHAGAVLTHVPGMTADLASFGGELTRAERVARRATELAPATATSAVVWLDYDAPDFVHEAHSARQAEAGASGLRRFQEGLRVGHQGPPAQHTVLGHSYGSLVVGKAAADGGLDADRVVFVGSPGVGVDSAAELRLPPDRVWSTTSRTDPIQYLPVAPKSLLGDLATAGALPVAGPLVAFGLPEDDLWFGRNPSDPGFGGRVFASQLDAGHVGYWEPGRPALDALAAITVGGRP